MEIVRMACTRSRRARCCFLSLTAWLAIALLPPVAHAAGIGGAGAAGSASGPARGASPSPPPALSTTPVLAPPQQKKPIQINPALIHALQQALLKTPLTQVGTELDQAMKDVMYQISRVSVSRFNYQHQAENCSKKTYTTEEQKLAGCLGGDTLDQCSSKLFHHCVDAARKKFHGDRNAMLAAQDHLAKALNAYNVNLKMIP